MKGQKRPRLVVATCIDGRNLNPEHRGRKRVFLADREIGTLGEAWLDAAAEELLARSQSSAFTVHQFFGPDGSQARVMLETYGPNKELVVLGGGHIASGLAKLGAMLGYRVTVVDNRPEYAAAHRFSAGTTVICCPYAELNRHVAFGGHTAVVIATHGHQYDLTCLTMVLEHVVPYIGVVGSRRKQDLVKQHLATRGLPEAAIHLPVGLDIGAETPMEIAVSIIAEIIAQERQRSGRPLSGLEVADTRGATSKPIACGEAPDVNLLLQLINGGDQGLAGAVATVVSATVLTPRKAGAKMIIWANGTSQGTIGGGLTESTVQKEAAQVMNTGRPYLQRFSLQPNQEQDLMVCGGDMEVFVEPIATLAAVLTEEDLNHVQLS